MNERCGCGPDDPEETAPFPRANVLKNRERRVYTVKTLEIKIVIRSSRFHLQFIGKFQRDLFRPASVGHIWMAEAQRLARPPLEPAPCVSALHNKRV